MQDIAVIIPVYNGADMLEACVQSVNCAGKRVSEIIIVDDGSTDQTLSVAEKLAEENKMIRVIHTENHGTYMARTTGMKAAKASYVTSIDVDDCYCPNIPVPVKGGMKIYPRHGRHVYMTGPATEVFQGEIEL